MTVLRPRKVIDELATILRRDTCPVVRHEAAYFLGTLKRRQVIAPLCDALAKDPDTLVQHEAAEALGDLGFAEAKLALENAKCSKSRAVRFTAQIALVQIGSAHSQGSVKRLF